MQEFLNRLRKNWKARQKWASRLNLEVFRVYDKDLPQFPFVIDRLGNWLVVGSYALHSQTNDEVLGNWSLLAEVFGVDADCLIFRERTPQKGTAQYNRLADRPVVDTVTENGLKFEVNLSQYLDVGLFLDHRKMRAYLLRFAKGQTCLNLFSYTGSVSVALAAGGARRVDSVDMSRTYMTWCERNFDLNQLPRSKHGFIQDDVTAWLKLEPQQKYDFIFLDPPSFSNSKSMSGTFDVARDHKWILELCGRHLNQDGLLFFSNNKRGFKLDQSALQGFSGQEISALTHSKDFNMRSAHKSYLFARNALLVDDFVKGLRRLGPEF